MATNASKCTLIEDIFFEARLVFSSRSISQLG